MAFNLFKNALRAFSGVVEIVYDVMYCASIKKILKIDEQSILQKKYLTITEGKKLSIMRRHVIISDMIRKLFMNRNFIL